LVVIIGIFTYVIDEDIFQYLDDIKLGYLLVAAAVSLLGISIDANRLVQMATLTGDRLSQWQAMKVLFGNYFFSFFTPGGSGGPVAQYLLLKRFGISGGKATLFILTRTLLSITVMVLILPFLFSTETNIPLDVPANLPYLLALLIVLGIGCAFWLARSARFIRWSRERVYLWSPKRFQRPLLRLHQDLSEVAFLFARNPFRMLMILLQTFLGLSVSYSLVYFLFLGFNLSLSPLLLLGRLFFLNFLIYFAPTPGGTGIAEGLFILLFSSMGSTSLIGVIAILWRIISEHLPAMVGFSVIIKEFGYHYFKDKFLQSGKEHQP